MIERLAKFWSLQITAAIIIGIICVLIITICMQLYIWANKNEKKSFGGFIDALSGMMFGILICIPIIISGEMLVLSKYEDWMNLSC